MTLENGNTSADSTAQKQLRGRPFRAGQSGNPAGRPKGARNKVSEKLLEALAEDFDTHGKDVIEKVRAERPHDYLKIVASLVPKQMEHMGETKTEHVISDRPMTPDEWREKYCSGVK